MSHGNKMTRRKDFLRWPHDVGQCEDAAIDGKFVD
jgi:hypothetical protein